MSTEQTIAALWEQTFGLEALDAQGDSKTFFQVSDGSERSVDALPEDSGITLGVRIGKGGFADVFSARQHSLRREVAVKQIREQSRGDYLRFFHHEVWLMAGLNHPNILPIHDLVRIDGCPSLVMKRVNGEAWDEQLAEACFKETMVLHREIQRLVDVCDAVAFAHSRGVLHLDLKPANVMCGAFGETLVMDWGCAALFDDSLWVEQPDLPRTAKITKPFGTPAFMAPELARGEGNALGPHTDIYLLGAILHLLLSGSPLRMGMTVRSTIEMAAQGERQPLPETAPSQLVELCRHATEPNIADRLCDLSVFRATLQYWLDTRESQTLTERALETLSEMEKAETLTAGQRQEGTQLLGVFEQAGRSGMKLPQAIDGEWRMRSLLAQTALRNGEPGVARVLAMPMPDAHRTVIQKQSQELQGQQSQAVQDDAWIGEALSKGGGKGVASMLLQVLSIQSEALGESHPQTLRTKESIAALYSGQGRFSESETLYNGILETHRYVLGAEHSRTLSVMQKLGSVYKDLGKYQPATALLEQVVAVRKRVMGVEHAETLEAMSDLGALYKAQGEYAEAESINLMVLEVQERTFGREHPSTLISVVRLAVLYKSQGRYTEAESLYLRALDSRERMLGREHPDTLSSVNNLSGLYYFQGRYTEAEPLYLRALEASERTLGRAHPFTLKCVNNLALLYQNQDRYTEAEPLYLRALEAWERTLGREHPFTLTSVNSVAGLYKSQGKYAEAESLYLRALEAQERILGREHPDTLTSVSNLSGLYYFQGRYTEAEPLYLRSLEARERTLGRAHPFTLNSVNNLALLYEAQGRYAEAGPLYRRALEARERTLGRAHPFTLNSVHHLAWFQLDFTTEIPHALFEQLLEGWTKTTDWKHHIARLGLALCSFKSTHDDTVAMGVLDDLVALLGKEHSHVLEAVKRIESMRRQVASSD